MRRGACVAGWIALAGLLGACADAELSRWEAGPGDCGPDAASTPSPEPWRRASPTDAGFDAAALEHLAERIERGELANLHALLVVRDGGLVFERYFSGDDAIWGRPQGRVVFGPDRLHDLRSVTKSVVGALVGIAHGDGLLPDVNAPVVSLLAGREAHGKRLGRLSLRHALTMSAGLAWDELSHPYWDPRNDEHAMSASADPVGYVLERDLVEEPGTAFRYNGGLPSVLAASVEHASGMSIDRFAIERLWCPLGVRRVDWVRHRSGLHLAASGLRLTPRDMARFGQLMLDHGRFGGRQIVPGAWARASLTPQVSTAGSRFETYGFTRYGYLWWLTRPPTVADDAGWLAVAVGNGGQRIVLYRPARLVIVITAGNYDSPDQGAAPREAIESVLRALRD